MTSMANLRKVVEWGITEGHTVSEIAQGLDLDYMTVGTVYMQIMRDRKDIPAHLRKKLPPTKKQPSRSKPSLRIEPSAHRAKTDERYRNWLFSVQGAKRTRGVT